MKVLLAASLLLVSAAPAFADEAPAPAPSPKASDEADKVICKREVVLGSRLPGPRRCKTKAQWDSNDRDSQDAIRNAQQNRRLIQP